MRKIFLLVVLAAGILSASMVWAQEVPEPKEFALADLWLLSHEAVLDGSPLYRGPVCAAVVLGWLSQHGFPRLLPDKNGDGRVDEADALVLAREFAEALAIEPEHPLRDVRLFDLVARYVAEVYPGEFLLKIWDDTFLSEYQAEFGKPFSPGEYSGILIEAYGNAGHGDYADELLSGEGVIVGLGQEGQVNTYFAGRSFSLAEAPEGWPIDVLDTTDDPFAKGVQGQVWPTYMRAGPTHWLVAYAGWIPLEFMLSLSPTKMPAVGEKVPGPCPTGAIGYDVVTVSSEWGRFQVEECVTRSGDRDLYSYRVTNIDFVYNGCGICEFFVPNVHVLPTLGQWGPVHWLVNPWGTWSWAAPSGDCGIMPGTTVEFGFAVPAPTTDSTTGAMVSACYVPKGEATASSDHLSTPSVSLVPRVKFRTTGPAPGEVGCPDLIVAKLVACWHYTPSQEIAVEVTAVIANIGTKASGSFWVRIKADGKSKLDHVSNLAPGASVTLSATFNVTPPTGGLPFPVDVDVHADYHDNVEECKETNNKDTFTVTRANMCR